MSDGNREEACEALADENGAGGSEEKKTLVSPFFSMIWEWITAVVAKIGMGWI